MTLNDICYGHISHTHKQVDNAPCPDYKLENVVAPGQGCQVQPWNCPKEHRTEYAFETEQGGMTISQQWAKVWAEQVSEEEKRDKEGVKEGTKEGVKEGVKECVEGVEGVKEGEKLFKMEVEKEIKMEVEKEIKMEGENEYKMEDENEYTMEEDENECDKENNVKA